MKHEKKHLVKKLVVLLSIILSFATTPNEVFAALETNEYSGNKQTVKTLAVNTVIPEGLEFIIENED